jgi:hypothetical protein
VIPAWVGKVYTDVLGPLTREQAAFVCAVLVQNMPRCESCKWWHGPQKDTDGREQCTQPTISPFQMDEFMTLPDFGCVLWEVR